MGDADAQHAGRRRGSSRRRVGRTLLFATALLAACLATLELIARAVLGVQPELLQGVALHPAQRQARFVAEVENVLSAPESSLALFDPRLGWRPRPGLDHQGDQINQQGLRGLRDYAALPAPGITRLAAFGDSFVYGSEVDTEQAWPHLLEQRMPHTEVLNYGVPGYGADQIYLRYLEAGEQLSPHVVLFGVASPAVRRMTIRSGAFSLLSSCVGKPRFVMAAGDEPTLIPNPFRSLEDLRQFARQPDGLQPLGAHDFWYAPYLHDNPLLEWSAGARLLVGGWYLVDRRYLDPERPMLGPPGQGVFNERASVFRAFEWLLVDFDRRAREAGMRPIVLLIPDGWELERARQGSPLLFDAIRRLAERHGLETIDLLDAFQAAPEPAPLDHWFFTKFHYTPEGHRVATEWLAEELQRRLHDDPS